MVEVGMFVDEVKSSGEEFFSGGRERFTMLLSTGHGIKVQYLHNNKEAS